MNIIYIHKNNEIHLLFETLKDKYTSPQKNKAPIIEAIPNIANTRYLPKTSVIINDKKATPGKKGVDASYVE